MFLLGLTVYSGLSGSQTATNNFAPSFVFVIFWLVAGAAQRAVRRRLQGVQPLAGHRAGRWPGSAQTAARGPLPAPLEYPERLGHWPAAAGIFAFATLELVASERRQAGERGDRGARLLGRDVRGDGALRHRPLDRAGGGVQRLLQPLLAHLPGRAAGATSSACASPLSGLADLKPVAGTVPLLAVIIGSVTFDGVAEAPLWTGIAPDIAEFFESIGFSPEKRARGHVPGRAGGGDSRHLRLLPARRGRGAQRGRRHLGGPAGEGLRALAGADRARLHRGALPHAAALPGPGDRADLLTAARLPGLQPAGRGRRRPLRHGQRGDRLRRDRRHHHVVLPGGVRGGRPRGGADPGPRPRAGALRRRAAGRALPVLDARGDGRLHEPGPVAAGAVERMIGPRTRRPLARPGGLLPARAGVPGLAGLHDPQRATARGEEGLGA